jgi:hypothetical protein
MPFPMVAFVNYYAKQDSAEDATPKAPCFSFMAADLQ